MEVFFVGVGEACDTQLANTSIHVQTSNYKCILCDCGFSVPHSYFNFCGDPDQLDMVWISHFHGDHFFGIPLLLLRLWEMRRSKPLLIMGQEGIEETVFRAMDLAFHRFRSKLCFDIQFIALEPGSAHEMSDVAFQSVQTLHSQRNLGLLIDDGQNRLYYSGDGRPTEEVAHLIHNCDLAVHEAFKLDEEIHHHGSVTGCLKLAITSDVRKMALVHLERTFRQNQKAEIDELLEQNPVLHLPVSGDQIIV